MSYLKSVHIRGKEMPFPTFFPDATRGVIRGCDSQDLENAKVEGLITNTYHLMSQPGQKFLKEFGGLKKFMDWKGWLITDSGGFQVLSMIYANKSFGTISDKGVTFTVGSTGKKERYNFTPEKSIEMQLRIGSDILISLDDVPRMGASYDEIKDNIHRTLLWAKRGKEEFYRLLKLHKIAEENRPLLFGVVQGGPHKDLRAWCAQELEKIGFDGYGFGGWPIDEDGNFDYETLAFTASVMPDDKPKYALGVGNPQAVVEGVKMGYTIFDCVLPTRDGRHRRLYAFTKDPNEMDILKEKQVSQFVHIMEEKYTRDNSPMSPYCDCHTCRYYSKAYVQHLFKIEDRLAERLASIHNLRMYTMVIEKLRENIALVKTHL